MHGPVAIVHWRGPVLGPQRVEKVASHIVVRFVGDAVFRVLLGESERDIEQYELLGARDSGAKTEQEEWEEQGAALHGENHGDGKFRVNAGCRPPDQFVC